ncbi:hypothetical protein TSUD_301250 [Trifolium subterraneum]|uniref:Uncharacterized protein n=1 Tax=Trifolium subterraneum TaxID=3900 RepID=A0A2Z6PBM5_TRISU|nr:hypothetical protein TSUD_301250 [Trifolium subterraneum]
MILPWFRVNATTHDPILSLIAPKITPEDNERLVAPITREELKDALFHMHSDKAPGPDGFNPAFYQHFWELCGNDIYEAAKEWLERGYFLSSLNETNICLIPKCENPVNMKDMRSISLCNVLYKMVSKLLANRLKGCLEKCVSEEQSTFIEGCSIIDNALIVIEVIHALKRKTRGTNGELAPKIDIRPIYPGRGLRQGDPLSPYLFILVTEGSNLHETNHLIQILKTYEQASGQEINLTKSEVFFSRNMSMATQEDLSKIMGVRHVLGTGNYLGLPSMIGRKKRDIFAYSVLQAIPSYVMSVYLLPEVTIKEIERMMNSFWWGGGANNKGIKWLTWDRMTYLKALGGMGFRDLRAFNLAMIAKQGWTIGDGTNIKAMSDPWLRGEEGAWIHSPQGQGAYNINIKELILPNEKMWDKAKIESLFSEDIVKRILYIPLFDMIEDDKLICVDSVSGQYSVKSGYNMMLNTTGRMEELAHHDDWKYIWKIHAPPKAKHLLWRICKGCLPTRIRLQESCISSIQVRQVVGLEQVITTRFMQVRTAVDLIKSICYGEDRNIAGLFAMLLWVLWDNRNARVWNESKEVGRSLGIKAKHLWEEWHSVQHHQQNNSHATSQQQPLSWQKLPWGWYKCKVDAGFHNEMNKTSTGWCLRNHWGRFVRVGTYWKEGKCSTIEGEAIALLEAMREMEHQGITHVIFETDSNSVVDAINKLCAGTLEFSSLICNIKSMLMFNSNFVVKFIKRQANMVAHTLARTAIYWSSRYVIELLPLYITPLVNNEMI